MSQPAERKLTPAEFLSSWADAWRGARVERMLSFYEDSKTVVAVESRGILRKGLPEIRRMYEDAFDNLTFEKVELEPEALTEAGDTAWATCRYKATIRAADGGRYILEVRGSFVMKRVRDTWQIALEHFSTIQDVPRVRRAGP